MSYASTLDLPRFLRARVVEDVKFHWPPNVRARIEKAARARMLILRVHHMDEQANDRHCVGCNYTPGGYHAVPDVDDCPVLRAVAEVYDTHPDYNASWRPDAPSRGPSAGPQLPFPVGRQR
jgi:hypothetical protein